MTGEPHRTRSMMIDISIIIALTVAFYATRVTDLTVRGEESRWASVAQEMRRGGDWIVPRQQGQPFLSRPPMGSWLIALTAAVRGECDLIAVRLPTILAVLGTALLIYGYARSFLSRVGALAAGVAFPCLPEILQMGRVAESDAVFAFFLGGACLVWHWGWSRAWPRAATWGLSYALLALATLTKGPQAPVTFFAAVGLFLLLTRQIVALLTRAHAAGLVGYVVIVGAWLVPCYLTVGSVGTWQILAGDSAGRFVGWKWLPVLEHLVRYPIEATGCTAPWSFLLLAIASRRFWATLEQARSRVVFLLLCAVVGFVPCWITPGGQTRYLMPLYPCVAVLAGVVIDRAGTAGFTAWLRVAFAGARWLVTANMLGVAVALAWLTWGAEGAEARVWKQPIGFMVAFIVVALIAIVLNVGYGPFGRSRVHPAGLVAVAGFVGLMYSGPVVSRLAARSTHAEAAVAELKQNLPGNVRLMSLGPVHHKFLYLNGNVITPIPAATPEQVPPGGYFCYDCWSAARCPLPFSYEELAVVNMDRLDSGRPQVQVIVARRLGNSRTGMQVTQK